MFTEVENGSPGNMENSPDQTEAVSDENRARFPDREVLISKTALCQNGWGNKPCVGTIKN